MRKTSFLLVIILLISGSIALAEEDNDQQSLKELFGSGTAPSSASDLTCQPGSVYGHLPNGFDALSAINGSYFLDNIPDDLGLISSITWWMALNPIWTVPNPATFDIYIYDDNAGSPGTLIDSYIGQSITGVNTNETMFLGFSPVYEFTFEFPSAIDIPAGSWIGIRDYPENRFYRFWLLSSDGDNSSVVYSYFFNIYLPIPTDFAFCVNPATFDLDLVILPQLGGTVDIDPPTGPYPYGSTVTLTATPNNGYIFDNYEYNPIVTDPVLALTITDTFTVTASFSIDPAYVPLSNWALMIGIALIVIFMAFRFRSLF